MMKEDFNWMDLTPNQQMYKTITFEKDPIVFCEDPYGLNIKLWDKPVGTSQKDILTKFYFTPGVQELVLVAGMGGGKTTLLSLLACIELKSLLLQDWPRILGIFRHSPLFVTVASVSEKQALDAVWNCLTPLIKQSPLFQFYEPEILADSVYFRKKDTVHLRLVSASADTAVGRRNKFVGIDEMAKFETTSGSRGGWQVRNSLKASTKNFGTFGRICELGSPKNPLDPLMTLYRKALVTPGMLGMRLASWEMNPTLTKASYSEEFEIDYRAAMANYGADPQAGEDLYFGDLDIFHWAEDNLLEQVQAGIQIEHPPFDYTLTGDPALKHDHFGLALGHLDDDKVIIDGAVAIGAEKEINPLEVNKFVLKVADIFYLKEAIFDTWYYPETEEDLRTQGTIVTNRIVTKKDYDEFKRYVYQNKVLLPRSRILKEEIASLVSNGIKVDHPRHGSKDVLDAVVQCTINLMTKRNITEQILVVTRF